MSNLWRIFSNICNSRLVSDRKAAVLPLFGVMVIMIVVLAGIAVDVSRTVNAREKLSYALDAAALSLAVDLSTTVMSDTEVREALADSMKANLGNVEFLDKAIKNLTYSIDAENGLVTVNSTASLNNYFVDIGGYMQEHLGPETFTFGAASQATFSQFDVELAMVLDVTGSMAPYVDSLKEAATSALNILIPEGTSEEDSKVRISVVPYSQGVNLGEYAQKVAKGAQGTQNCVTEREGAAQFTDDAYDYDSSNRNSFFGGGSWDCAPSPQLEPLTAKRNKIETAISKLTATGGTAGQTGIAWGWYTLSPNWANLWPTRSEPVSYSDDKVLKFAIIMTDGDFNTFYRKRRMSNYDCDYERYWRNVTETCKGGTRKYWYQDFSENGYGGEPAQRAVSLCKEMKSAGITVYTVFFGSYNPDPIRVMKECASEDGYYQATSKDDLVRAFANIAKKIQSIYLSK
ncbi:pilus assembly protein TadG-related protein [Roseibium sp.]|uniref:pilus assembly protein TadG-related protein n=1 Tax=Roseibium sp. TaxID=1936156 RepID=UPI003D0B5BF9